MIFLVFSTRAKNIIWADVLRASAQAGKNNFFTDNWVMVRRILWTRNQCYICNNLITNYNTEPPISQLTSPFITSSSSSSGTSLISLAFTLIITFPVGRMSLVPTWFQPGGWFQPHHRCLVFPHSHVLDIGPKSFTKYLEPISQIHWVHKLQLKAQVRVGVASCCDPSKCSGIYYLQRARGILRACGCTEFSSFWFIIVPGAFLAFFSASAISISSSLRQRIDKGAP